MLDQTSGLSVPFRITDPERIPAQRYYDPGSFELERERLWPHVWQMAARLEEIPNIGDYVEYRILDKSMIVVRTKSGDPAVRERQRQDRCQRRVAARQPPPACCVPFDRLANGAIGRPQWSAQFVLPSDCQSK